MIKKVPEYGDFIQYLFPQDIVVADKNGKDNKTVKTVTFQVTDRCNLQCSYCEIAKSASPLHYREAAAVKQALADGTFLKNTNAICDKYNIDRKKIGAISLWGQEPTLTLREFALFFKDFI